MTFRKRSIYAGVFETLIFVHQCNINWKDLQVDPIGTVRSHLPSGDKNVTETHLYLVRSAILSPAIGTFPEKNPMVNITPGQVTLLCKPTGKHLLDNIDVVFLKEISFQGVPKPECNHFFQAKWT